MLGGKGPILDFRRHKIDMFQLFNSPDPRILWSDWP